VDIGSPAGGRPEHEKDPPGTGGRRAVGEVTARYVLMSEAMAFEPAEYIAVE
jgi:hypothetical protein